jgi:hypothetical protein
MGGDPMPEPREGFDVAEGAPWEGAEVQVSRWEPVDLGAVLRGEVVTPLPAAFERTDGIRLLYPGRIHAFFGEPEACKSWIAQAVTAEQLKTERHVIYADFEDGPETMVERQRAMGVSDELIGQFLTYLNPAGRFDDLAEAVLEDVIKRRGLPALAFIDGVTQAMADLGLDPEKGPDVAKYYGGSPRWLARAGAAVTLIDHVTKSREGRGRWAIGSERKLSGLDGAAYGFEAIHPFGRGRTGLVKITVAKDRCGHIRQHAGPGGIIAMAELKSWPDDGVTVTFDVPEKVDGPGFRPTRLMERLSAVIVEKPGLTSRALCAAVGGKNDLKDLALELLVTEGYVDVKPGPRGARLHHSVMRFDADRSDSEEGDLEAF